MSASVATKAAVFKKLLVSGTEIIQTLFALCSSDDAIFGAAAVAQIQNRTAAALLRQRLLFGPAKACCRALSSSMQRDASRMFQSMLKHREMVATINIPVALQNGTPRRSCER